MVDQTERPDDNRNPQADEAGQGSAHAPEPKRLTVRKPGRSSVLGSTALLDEKNQSPGVTYALDRDPTMQEGTYRGNQTLDKNASVVLQFMPSGLCHVLTLVEPTVVGRVTETINMPLIKAERHGVSREHCRFRREGQTLKVADLGSRNGTYLNGQRLDPQLEYILAEGDELALGTLHLTVHFSSGKK